MPKEKSSKKVTKSKVREILHHGMVHGHKLTRKQMGFFGARVSGSSVKRKRK